MFVSMELAQGKTPFKGQKPLKVCVCMFVCVCVCARARVEQAQSKMPFAVQKPLKVEKGHQKTQKNKNKLHVVI